MPTTDPLRIIPRGGVLRSTYRRESGRFDINVELSHGQFEPGDLLGMCTGIAIRPGATSSAVEVEALATRLVLRPDPPELIDGKRRWTISDLRPLWRVIHANDGPVSAWIERAGGAAVELDVLPPELEGADGTLPRRRSGPRPPADPTANPLPRPAKMMTEGQLRPDVSVRIANDPAGRWPAVAALAGRLGIDVSAGTTTLALDAAVDPAFVDSSYELVIKGPEVRLRGGSLAALTHGMITLAQLVAAGVPERVQITDSPTHRHRGLSVDLARRWFEPAVVERLIDLAAWRKLSHLQLHLTDDEAWRVPVAEYPSLAEIGGVRGYGLAIGPLCGSGAAPYGRAYTPTEIRRWANRAEGIAVELVPEIDIPGHNYAAIVAVPDLGDQDDPSQVQSVQGFRDNVLVPGSATTRFLHDVFGTLADLFPNSPVLHLGGDEVPAGAWTQSPRAADYGREHGIEPGPRMAGALIADAASAIAAAGRNWAGWQEVAEFDHAIEPTYVIAWTGTSSIRAVLDRGYRVVASPGDAYYLDMAIDDGWSTPGQSWAGSTPLTTTCGFDLADHRTSDGRLIGGQAAIWGEHISSLEVFDGLLFPRLDAVAEATWTGDTTGRAEDLTGRAQVHPTLLRQAYALAPRGGRP